MNLIALTGFSNEIEKIAINASQLAEAAKRLNPLPVSEAKAIMDIPFVKAFSAPTKAHIRKAIVQAGLVPSKDIINKYFKDHLSNVGKIFVDPDVGKLFNPSAEGPALNKLYNIATIHEGLERSVKPMEIKPGAMGHRSPIVPAKELNMINTASPDLTEAMESIRAKRVSSGEHELLRKQLTEQFGSQVEQFMQPGRKIPKAMLRRFVRQLQDA